MNLMHPLLRVALATSITAPAFAGTIVVSKNGPVQSLQAAIDAASAGDTVKVLAGTYREPNVLIPNGKNGLRIVGKGNVVLDATTASGFSSGLRIAADDVEVQGLMVRGAEGNSGDIDGFAFDITGSGATITNCSIMGGVNGGILAVANDITVRKTSFSKVPYPIRFTVTTALLEDCEFENCYADNVHIVATNVTVKGCRIRHVGTRFDSGTGEYFGAGIRVQAANTTISDCTVEFARNGCVIDSSTANVTGCTFRALAVLGIDFRGSVVSIDANRIDGVTDGSGIWVNDSGVTSISKNEIRNVCFHGIAVLSNTTGVTISENVIESGGMASIGISSQSMGATIVGNRVRNCRKGILTVASFNTIEQNDCRDNVLAGIVCGGDNSSILSNVCKSNIGEGIQNTGMGSTITGNVAKKNRIDITNNGTIPTFANNQFQTGGPMTFPESN